MCLFGLRASDRYVAIKQGARFKTNLDFAWSIYQARHVMENEARLRPLVVRRQRAQLIRFHRPVDRADRLRRPLSSRYDAGTAQVFSELGYRMPTGPVMLEPFARLAYVNLHRQSRAQPAGSSDLLRSRCSGIQG
jgi:hypothetical protein